MSAATCTVGRHNRTGPDGRPVIGNHAVFGNGVPKHSCDEPLNGPRTEPLRWSVGGALEASPDLVDTRPMPVVRTAAPPRSPWFTPGQRLRSGSGLPDQGPAVGTTPIDPSNPNALGRFLTAMRRKWGEDGHSLDEQERR